MKNAGFTLVELLIVIGLLGAIALIVIAAINPIEQTNRARDTRFKADGGQLISAIDRYFAAKSEFPWMTGQTGVETEDAYGFVTAATQGVGICGTGCTVDGFLITNEELKTEFRNRDFIKNSSLGVERQIMIGKDQGSSASIYACFIPLSKTTREKSCTDEKVSTISTADGSRTVVPTTTCQATGANWVTNLWYVCIPE